MFILGVELNGLVELVIDVIGFGEVKFGFFRRFRRIFQRDLEIGERLFFIGLGEEHAYAQAVIVFRIFRVKRYKLGIAFVSLVVILLFKPGIRLLFKLFFVFYL